MNTINGRPSLFKQVEHPHNRETDVKDWTTLATEIATEIATETAKVDREVSAPSQAPKRPRMHPVWEARMAETYAFFNQRDRERHTYEKIYDVPAKRAIAEQLLKEKTQ